LTGGETLHERPLVLTVDDAPEMLQLLRLILKREGFDVVTAHHAASALHTAREAHPDAILLDINMPNMDGFELCSRLRQTTDVPIIFVSGRDAAEDVARAYSLGGDDYLVKPFSRADLVARLLACLSEAAVQHTQEPAPSTVEKRDKGDIRRHYLDAEDLLPRVPHHRPELVAEGGSTT